MKKRILIVDDERVLLNSLKTKFAERGYEIETAQNGHDFYKCAMRGKPDLIILDILLPDGLGTDHYDRLLYSGFDRNTPVIFISTLAEKSTPRHSPPEGIFAMFGKPFDCEELLCEAKKLLAA